MEFAVQGPAAFDARHTLSQGRSANITMCAPSLAAESTDSSLAATA